jgi:guanylate kinase
MTRNWRRLARVSNAAQDHRGGNGFLARVDHQGAKSIRDSCFKGVGIVVNPH